MFKIGDFSKISQVSARMLRHYDDIDLFKPAHIDPFTGYRYYTVDQLPRLNRLLALKDLGLSLDEVALMLDDDLPASEIRGMLRLKHAELRQRINEEQGRLARVETRLQQIEREGQMPEYEAVLKSVGPQNTVSLREVSPSLSVMDGFLSSIYLAGKRSGVKELARCYAIFYDDEFSSEKVDWEVGFTIEGSFDGSIALDDGRRLTAGALPGVALMASTIYQGDYIGLHQGYSALGNWVAANGYRIVGVGRELFLRMGWLENPPSDAANVTEIQFPVEPN